MKLTSNQTKHVAKLANLPISDQDLGKYTEQLSEILDYVDQLESIDTKDDQPTYNVSGQASVLAKDEPSESLEQEEALANASTNKDGFFVTKGVFSDE